MTASFFETSVFGISRLSFLLTHHSDERTANEAREQCYDLRQKQVIRATGLPMQCTDTYRDSHDATRHKTKTNTGIQLSAISLAIPFAIRYAGFVLSRITVRPDGRTPFQYLLGTPCVFLLCMFGESVFALIPDHEVRAAKLTNRWISGCWWGRDASSDEHLVGTKHDLLKCRSVRRKPPGEQWSRRETVEARGTKWNFDVEMDSGIPGQQVTSRPDEGMPTATALMEISTVPPLAPPPEEHVHEMRGQGVLRAFWSEIGRTPGCRGSETPGPGKSHTRECKMYQDAWDESRRTASAEEATAGPRVRAQQIPTRRGQKRPV